jgi:DNA (cytosine-5)-methyltransferase 1
MYVYYNENDLEIVEWLKENIKAKLLPEGDIDTRSITEVKKEDVISYKQCHFFAGFGGWAYALQLANWPENEAVWTGSCPCQPFSIAGRGNGEHDNRHLWPEFYRLIRECHPTIIFGEQVKDAIRLGNYDGILTDLERENYACGTAILGAQSVGAPHLRSRLYWVADSDSARRKGRFSWWSSQRWKTLCKDIRLCCSNFWKDSKFVQCGDGKHRRIPLEPALLPLAYGLSGSVVLLRGAGNSIVPQIAAEFIDSVRGEI